MKTKKLLILRYLLTALWLGAILILSRFPMTPLTLTFTVFGLLAIPGLSLVQLMGLKFKNCFDHCMLSLTFGLVLVLALSAMAMLAGTSIFVLQWVYLIIIALLWAGALMVGWKQKEEPLKFSWQALFSWEILIYLVIAAISTVVIIGVGIQGTLFRGGDPNFHLSILRKTYEGTSLAPTALGFIKGETLHVAYGLPIWHIFLGLMARIVHADPFVLWKTISIPLSVLSVMVWYWLPKQIFKNQFLAIVSLLLFVNYIFNWNTGFLFTVLPVPDSLNNYLLFPWIVAVFLFYVFYGEEKFGNLKILITMVILGFLTAAIHLTQYLYLLALIFVFGLIWLAIGWQDKDYKKILRRIGAALGVNIILLIPAFIYFQIKTHIIELFLESSAKPVSQIKYHGFYKLGTPGKFALILLPLALVFVKKQRELLFILGTFILLWLTFSSPVSHFLAKTFGFIFTNRIYGSIIWHWLIIALAVGLLLMGIDRASLFLPKLGRRILGILSLIGAGVLIWAQIRFQAAAKAWNWLYGDLLDDWMVAHYIWIIGILCAVALGLLIWQFWRPKFDEQFVLSEPKNGPMALSGIIVITVIMFGTTYSYGWDYVKMAWARPFLFQPATTQDFRNGDDNLKNTIKSMGGKETVDFIKNNIKPKSVFLVPGGLVYTFPTILDQYMVDYPRSKTLLRTQEIYSPKKQISIEEAVKKLTESKTQYILLNDAPDQNQSFFDRYPDHFEKIFDGGAAIYKFKS